MSEIITQLEEATPFQLWRLRALIDRFLDDPGRLLKVRSKLHIGQRVAYFDPDENREISAIVIRILRTRVLVKNTDDGKQWRLPLYMLNIDELPTDAPIKNQKIDRLTLKVGEKVGFIDNRQSNRPLYGVVTKLNPKTATVKIFAGGIWRVSYSALFYVLDVEIGINNMQIAE